MADTASDTSTPPTLASTTPIDTTQPAGNIAAGVRNMASVALDTKTLTDTLRDVFKINTNMGPTDAGSTAPAITGGVSAASREAVRSIADNADRALSNASQGAITTQAGNDALAAATHEAVVRGAVQTNTGLTDLGLGLTKQTPGSAPGDNNYQYDPNSALAQRIKDSIATSDQVVAHQQQILGMQKTQGIMGFINDPFTSIVNAIKLPHEQQILHTEANIASAKNNEVSNLLTWQDPAAKQIISQTTKETADALVAKKTIDAGTELNALAQAFQARTGAAANIAYAFHANDAQSLELSKANYQRWANNREMDLRTNVANFSADRELDVSLDRMTQMDNRLQDQLKTDNGLATMDANINANFQRLGVINTGQYTAKTLSTLGGDMKSALMPLATGTVDNMNTADVINSLTTLGSSPSLPIRNTISQIYPYMQQIGREYDRQVVAGNQGDVKISGFDKLPLQIKSAIQYYGYHKDGVNIPGLYEKMNSDLSNRDHGGLENMYHAQVSSNFASDYGVQQLPTLSKYVQKLSENSGGKAIPTANGVYNYLAQEVLSGKLTPEQAAAEHAEFFRRANVIDVSNSGIDGLRMRPPRDYMAPVHLVEAAGVPILPRVIDNTNEVQVKNEYLKAANPGKVFLPQSMANPQAAATTGPK